MCPQYQHLWDAEKELSKDKAMTTIRLYHERLLRTILYTTWDNSWYQADKALGDWYSEFDDWFFKDYNDTKAYQIWSRGIDYITNSLGEFIRQDDSGKIDGLMLFSKRYFISDMKPTLK